MRLNYNADGIEILSLTSSWFRRHSFFNRKFR